MRAVVVLLVLLAACGDNIRGNISIAVAPDRGDWEPAIAEMIEMTPYRGLTLGAGGDYRIELVEDAAIPAEGYRLEAAGEDRIVVHANDVLGAQYGTAAALEALGFRFRHPLDPYVPRAPELRAFDEEVHKPQIRVRGYQLHTLHPTEAYFAFWEPSAQNGREARQIIDWVIKNRGNYLQWVALEDIIDDPDRHAAWKVFTRELIDYAHARGVRVGLNIQLFGKSNLQLAFDLIDEDIATRPAAEQIAERLPLITDGLPFDVYNLSFGEFFNAAPDVTVAGIDEVEAQLDVLAPNAELHGFVHVGAKQRIQYMGEDLIFYFLVKFADPDVIPSIHTVMFYNLFETASQAYHHADFAEHRAYLTQRICAGQKADYIPETAYWVAFDNTVPQMYPVYVRNRWFDLDQLKKTVTCGPLDSHVLFSTGWEWGYWLNDVTALRTSYELTATPDELIAAEFEPELGAAVAPMTELMALQHQYVHLRGLAAYLSGRDSVIDAGDLADIVSQPDRITFADLVKLGMTGAFEADVLTPLREYADAVDALARRIHDADLPSSRWTSELRDGFAIDAARAYFVLAVYSATVAHINGESPTEFLEDARELLETGQTIVRRRHRDLHDPRPARLLEQSSPDKFPNRTAYQYGYLHMPDALCFWVRELRQVEAIVGAGTDPVPACFFQNR